MKQKIMAMAAGVAIGYFICKIQGKSKKYRTGRSLHLGKGLPGAKENHAWGQDKKEIEYL